MASQLKSCLGGRAVGPLEAAVRTGLQSGGDQPAKQNRAVTCGRRAVGGGKMSHVGPWFVRKVVGIGDFMAMEITLDVIMTEPGAFIQNCHDWTPLCDGAKRGASRGFGRSLSNFRAATVTDLESIRAALGLVDARYSSWPLLQVQFSLCEYDKFCRTSTSTLRAYFAHAPTPKERWLQQQLNRATQKNLKMEHELVVARSDLKRVKTEMAAM